ncbi:response regulator [Shewanella youngdeokensis]|uniref:Response regulator n=1 Tax=Shewanella youngdeokensis TaxID=2999068 RepID=A0ABZ0K289_9GAMM|nr:response regulator [Shewanella sp. DAU334]
MTSPKILIVDDSTVSSALLLSILGKDYNVTTINSGMNAEALVTSLQPDCILLDIMMPGKNGYQVLKELKDNPLTYEIPVIVISSLNENSDQELAIKIGAHDYIFKPLVPDDVHQKINSCLKF